MRRKELDELRRKQNLHNIRQIEERRIHHLEDMNRREKAFLQEQISREREIEKLNSIIRREKKAVGCEPAAGE